MGYLETIGNYPAVKLAKKEFMETIRSDSPMNIGSDPRVGTGNLFGAGPAGISDRNIKNQISYREYYTRKAPGTLVLKKLHSFFVADKNNSVFPIQHSAFTI